MCLSHVARVLWFGIFGSQNHFPVHALLLWVHVCMRNGNVIQIVSTCVLVIFVKISSVCRWTVLYKAYSKWLLSLTETTSDCEGKCETLNHIMFEWSHCYHSQSFQCRPFNLYAELRTLISIPTLIRRSYYHSIINLPSLFNLQKKNNYSSEAAGAPRRIQVDEQNSRKDPGGTRALNAEHRIFKQRDHPRKKASC